MVLLGPISVSIVDMSRSFPISNMQAKEKEEWNRELYLSASNYTNQI